jgi:hypothetical protein
MYHLLLLRRFAVACPHRPHFTDLVAIGLSSRCKWNRLQRARQRARQLTPFDTTLFLAPCIGHAALDRFTSEHPNGRKPFQSSLDLSESRGC